MRVANESSVSDAIMVTAAVAVKTAAVSDTTMDMSVMTTEIGIAHVTVSDAIMVMPLRQWL